jgi:hypothetical protein
MKSVLLLTIVLIQGSSCFVSGFSTPAANALTKLTQSANGATQKRHQSLTTFSVAATSESPEVAEREDAKAKKKERLQELRKQGGPLTFNTPIGALNPFAIYYGLTSILLGIPWFISLKICSLFYFITRGRFDKKVRVVFCWIEPTDTCRLFVPCRPNGI